MSGTPSTTDPSSASHIFIMTPSVPLMILPMCMYLARTMGGARGGPGGPAGMSGRGGGLVLRSGRGRGGDAATAAAMDGDVSGSARGSSSSKKLAVPKNKFSAMF